MKFSEDTSIHMQWRHQYEKEREGLLGYRFLGIENQLRLSCRLSVGVDNWVKSKRKQEEKAALYL